MQGYGASERWRVDFSEVERNRGQQRAVLRVWEPAAQDLCYRGRKEVEAGVLECSWGEQVGSEGVGLDVCEHVERLQSGRAGDSYQSPDANLE